MSQRAYQLGSELSAGESAPFSASYPWYVLLESGGHDNDEVVQTVLTEEADKGGIRDAVVAKNRAESERLWRVRHGISEGQKAAGVSIKHDVSVPIDRIEEFLRKADKTVETLQPGARVVAFGHVGDGNLHYNVSQPVSADAEAFREAAKPMTKAIYNLVADLGGSFSAEHGIGVLKRSFLQEYRGGIELDMMRTLKQALDPKNTLNPGKVI